MPVNYTITEPDYIWTVRDAFALLQGYAVEICQKHSVPYEIRAANNFIVLKCDAGLLYEKNTDILLIAVDPKDGLAYVNFYEIDGMCFIPVRQLPFYEHAHAHATVKFLSHWAWSVSARGQRMRAATILCFFFILVAIIAVVTVCSKIS